MAAYSCKVDVRQPNGSYCIKDSESLVPYDIIAIPEGKILPCDILLLRGSVVVNEAMLTGETVPMFKVEIPETSEEFFDADKSSKNTLYCGTTVM